ncbi:hypothetical protein MICRO8M_20074 [Microbacterium sp. 8M]|nr:hypothetical protein MICRO8M_20074 [Microbacterium sp. 8M]
MWTAVAPRPPLCGPAVARRASGAAVRRRPSRSSGSRRTSGGSSVRRDGIAGARVAHRLVAASTIPELVEGTARSGAGIDRDPGMVAHRPPQVNIRTSCAQIAFIPLIWCSNVGGHGLNGGMTSTATQVLEQLDGLLRDLCASPEMEACFDGPTGPELVSALQTAGAARRRLDAVVTGLVGQVEDRDRRLSAERVSSTVGCRDVTELLRRSLRTDVATARQFVRAARLTHRDVVLSTGDLLPAPTPPWPRRCGTGSCRFRGCWPRSGRWSARVTGSVPRSGKRWTDCSPRPRMGRTSPTSMVVQAPRRRRTSWRSTPGRSCSRWTRTAPNPTTRKPTATGPSGWDPSAAESTPSVVG